MYMPCLSSLLRPGRPLNGRSNELGKTRLLLETRIKEVKEESKVWAEVAAKAREEARELRNLNEELKTDVLEKDTRLDQGCQNRDFT